LCKKKLKRVLFVSYSFDEHALSIWFYSWAVATHYFQEYTWLRDHVCWSSSTRQAWSTWLIIRRLCQWRMDIHQFYSCPHLHSRRCVQSLRVPNTPSVPSNIICRKRDNSVAQRHFQKRSSCVILDPQWSSQNDNHVPFRSVNSSCDPLRDQRGVNRVHCLLIHAILAR
jgi:hypothetical protein